MKTTTIAALSAAVLLTSLPGGQAAALSCLPVEAYLKDVVGKENIVIFTGTARDTVEEKTYTAEIVEVTAAHQGYLEGKTFVYHQLDETWGYLCNPGPSEAKNAESIYVAGRDEYGKLMVHQRLDTDSEYADVLMEDLKDAEVAAGVVGFSATDRMNLIMTTLREMLTEIGILLKEHAYWKSGK